MTFGVDGHVVERMNLSHLSFPLAQHDTEMYGLI